MIDSLVALSIVESVVMQQYVPHCSPRRIVEHVLLVWLDGQISESDNDSQNSIIQLRRVVNSLRTFTNPDRCIEFLSTKIKDEKVILIVSGELGQTFVPRVSDFHQLDSIYVFCSDKIKHEQWAKNYRKVQSVDTNISAICTRLMKDVKQISRNLIPISIIESTTPEESFIYGQLVKETLLNKIYDGQQAKEEFLEFARIQYADNERELNIINEFEQSYSGSSSICWCIRPCFIHQLLHHALRTRDNQVITKMGFFIQNLYRQIEKVFLATSAVDKLTVFHSQGISPEDFAKIKGNGRCLLSFHTFLSCTTDRQVALDWARRVRENSLLVAILFTINIDTLISSIAFTSLDQTDSISDSDTRLIFSMNPSFRIDSIKQMECGIWNVSLSLASDDDEQLTLLMESSHKVIHDANGSSPQVTKWMLELGEYERPLKIYQTRLENIPNDDSNQLWFVHYQLGRILASQSANLDRALLHYRRSADIASICLSSDDPQWTSIYNGIASILYQQGHLDDALDYFQRTFNNDLEQIAIRHDNIGTVLKDQGKYDQALASYERALNLRLERMSPLDPFLANSYYNLASLHMTMENYPYALEFYEKTLAIRQKSLTVNHQILAEIHHNISQVFYALGRNQEAVDHAQRALAIIQDIHSSNIDHPHIQQYQNCLDQLKQTTD